MIARMASPCWNTLMGGNGPGLLVVRSESQLLAVRHSSARCRSSKVLNGSAYQCDHLHPTH